MSFGLSKIEEFFETKFEPEGDLSQGPTRFLFCFDGVAHWQVSVDLNKQLIGLSSDPNTAFPVVEVVVFYSKILVRIESYTGVKADLTILPKGSSGQFNFLVLSKNWEDKISLFTNSGEPSEEWRDSAVQDLFAGTV